jgi:hypothetical protein
MVFGRDLIIDTSPPNHGGVRNQEFALRATVLPDHARAIRMPHPVVASRDPSRLISPQDNFTVGYSPFTSGGTP